MRTETVFEGNIRRGHMNAPSNKHWLYGKWFFRYLQVTKVKAFYTNKSTYDLAGESDAHWSVDVIDGKSMTCYFKLN